MSESRAICTERKTILTPELKRDLYHLRLQATYDDADTVIELRERIHKIRYTVWKIIRDHKIRRRISKRDELAELAILRAADSDKGDE